MVYIVNTQIFLRSSYVCGWKPCRILKYSLFLKVSLISSCLLSSFCDLLETLESFQVPESLRLSGLMVSGLGGGRGPWRVEEWPVSGDQRAGGGVWVEWITWLWLLSFSLMAFGTQCWSSASATNQPTNRPTDGPTSAYRTIFQGRESTSEPIRKDGLASLCMKRKCFVKSDFCCLDLVLTRMNVM